MNKQTLDLNKMGLAPMSEFEMMEVEGGNLWTWILGGAGAVVGFLVGGVGGAIEGAIIGATIGLGIDANTGHNGTDVYVGGNLVPKS
jgi:hypothetical protein